MAVGVGAGIGAAEPRDSRRSDQSTPYAGVIAFQPASRLLAEAATQVQRHTHGCRAAYRGDASKHDGAVAAARQCQRLAALDDRAVGDPAAVPDQAALFVVAAPNAALGGGDGVAAVPADQRREHGVIVPSWEAHPREVATRPDQDAALAVSQERVLAQHVWICRGEVRIRAHRLRRVSPAASTPAPTAPTIRPRCVVAHS